MLLFLYETFVERWGFFNVLHYISFRAVFAALTGFMTVMLCMPSFIRGLLRYKARQSIREDGPRLHQNKKGTPTMGGLLIVLATLLVALLAMDWKKPLVWVMLLTTLSFAFVGFLDDFLKILRGNSQGLSARLKLLGQILAAFLVSIWVYSFSGDEAGVLYVPFFKEPFLYLGIFYIPFAVLLLISSSNAVNLSDGLDGLATGLSLIVASSFAVLAYLSGRFDFASYLNIPFVEHAGELTIFTFGFIGALLGFLWYNAHPAKIMMGDVGSLFIGGILGLLAMILKKELLFILLGGIFVAETLSVIFQVLVYKRTSKRLFLMAPLHHHFELKGWSEVQIVIRFWILAIFFVLLSFVTLKLQ